MGHQTCFSPRVLSNLDTLLSKVYAARLMKNSTKYLLIGYKPLLEVLQNCDEQIIAVCVWGIARYKKNGEDLWEVMNLTASSAIVEVSFSGSIGCCIMVVLSYRKHFMLISSIEN